MTIEMDEEVATMDATNPCHQFHAEGSALSGDLRAPIRQKIETQAPIELNDRRGGHLTRFVSDVSIEGLVSFKRAETRVSGSMIKGKWVTLATTILEGLNVFEVISVDRVIAQVSTSHARIRGHVPKVTFLGSKFENLQVSGIPVEITYNYGVCPAPQNDDSYLSDEKFVGEASKWTKTIVEKKILFGNAKTEYEQRSTTISKLLEVVKDKDYKSLKNDGRVSRLRQFDPNDNRPRLTCSLVESIDISRVKKQLPRVETVGHVIVIPDFGAVSLGEIEVGLEEPREVAYSCGTSAELRQMSNYFELTMLNMELGCIGDASLKAARSKTNGTTNP